MKISDLVLIQFIEMMQREGWTAKYAGQKLGFSQVYVTNVINKRENPSKKFLEKSFLLLITYQKLMKQTSKIKELN